jgi:dienelactone hydrolase
MLWLALLALSAASSLPASFDGAAARDAATLAALEVAGSARHKDGVTVTEVRFTSTAWNSDDRAQSIRIAGYLAVPDGATAANKKPGVLLLHGLGWHADPDEAREVARNVDVVALAMSAPGLGHSEGVGVTEEQPEPLFNTLPTIRASWLYQYAFAAMRALTVLGTRAEVDPQGLVMSGNSMGAVTSFIVNGVDDRVRGIVAVSGSGGIERGVRQGTWLRRLVQSAGLTAKSPRARALFARLDPLRFAAHQHGAVYMIVGAQDEFFALDQVLATFAAVRAPEKSLELVADYDHGWYFGRGCPAACMPGGAQAGAATCPKLCPTVCPTGSRPPYCGPQASYNRHEDFVARWALNLRAMVARHAARPPRRFAPPAAPPRVTRERGGVRVDVTGPIAPRAVRLAISDNGGYTFGQVQLSQVGSSYHYAGRVPPSAILLAEVEQMDGAVATSLPVLPADFVPKVRPFGPF